MDYRGTDVNNNCYNDLLTYFYFLKTAKFVNPIENRYGHTAVLGMNFLIVKLFYNIRNY